MYPVGPPVWRDDRPVDYSYAGLLVRAGRAPLLGHLADAGFSGYVGPAQGDWVVLVPARLHGPVTGRGADLETLGAELARRLDDVTVATSVHRDRVLRLAMWAGRRELGRYLSNPAYGTDEDDDVPPDPQGLEHADAFATACGCPERAEDLAEVLGEILDEDEQIESERLTTVLRMLGMPRWLVAAGCLPGDVPGGPSAAQVTRLFRGRTGLPARARAWLALPTRWRRTG